MEKQLRIALVWEHGKNLGHIARLLEISRMIKNGGATPVWVVPFAYKSHPLLLEESCEIYTVPTVGRDTATRSNRVDSFADILISLGFADAEFMRRQTKSWMALFREIAPDRVVLDYAPIAKLSAYLMQIPALEITNGFDAPPADCPIFGIFIRGAYLEQKNAQKVQLIDETIRSLSRDISDGVPGGINHYVNYPLKIFDCLPETDPYGPRQNRLYIGPLISAKIRLEGNASWFDAKGATRSEKIFAYLRNVSAPRALLDAFFGCGVSVFCVWPDAPTEFIGQHADGAVQISRNPVNIEKALSEASFFVNSGSTTTANLAVLFGLPQLVIPSDIEKMLFARSLEKIGVGIFHRAGASFEEEISILTRSTKMQESAAAVSKKYAGGILQKNRQSFLSSLLQPSFS